VTYYTKVTYQDPKWVPVPYWLKLAWALHRSATVIGLCCMYVLTKHARLICESVSVISGTSYWFNYQNTSSVKSTKQTNYMLNNRYSISAIMSRPALAPPPPQSSHSICHYLLLCHFLGLIQTINEKLLSTGQCSLLQGPERELDSNDEPLVAVSHHSAGSSHVDPLRYHIRQLDNFAFR
jgi:hypothetical protein